MTPIFVSAEPYVGADADQRPGEQTERRQPQARALLRVRDELEGNRCEEYAAGERRNKRCDTRGQT
jgi:hypothetical protein